MSVLNPTIDNATQAANQIRGIVKQQYQQLGRSGMQGFKILFNNPKATPNEIAVALGTDFKSIMELAQLNISTVTSAATIGNVTPPTIPSVPEEALVTFNDDGSGNIAVSASSSSAMSVRKAK